MTKTLRNKEIVVLLHGIGHNFLNMVILEWVLKRNGYATLNLTYPSRKHAIKDLAAWLDDKLTKEDVWNKHERINFVGHSMGGLVIGTFLDEHKTSFTNEKIGRVVMLGTPHGGSEVADFLHKHSIYKRVFGPAGLELTTNARSKEKIKPWYELGIVAGRQNWLYPLGLFCIKKEHDGCVSVESTMLEGMKDHIILPVMHGVMGWSPKIHKQTVHFLQNGLFAHSDSSQKTL